MNEKRFTLDLDSDWWTISDNNTNNERLWGQDVVDLLNNLHKENRKLRQCLNEIYLISSRESIE